MGASDVNDRNRARSNSTPPQNQGIGKIAAQLRALGYETILRRESAGRAKAFIEIRVPEKDLKRIEQVVEKENGKSSYRIITPKDTTALPDTVEEHYIPVLITLTSSSKFSSREKSQLRSSSL